MMDEMITRDEVDRTCKSLKRLARENLITTPYGDGEIATYGLSAQIMQEQFTEIERLRAVYDAAKRCSTGEALLKELWDALGDF